MKKLKQELVKNTALNKYHPLFRKTFHELVMMSDFSADEIFTNISGILTDSYKEIIEEKSIYDNDLNGTIRLPIIKISDKELYTDVSTRSKVIIEYAKFLGLNENDDPYFEYRADYIPIIPNSIYLTKTNKRIWVILTP